MTGSSDTGRATTRRDLLQAAGAGSMLGALATLFSTGAAAREAEPQARDPGDGVFEVERTGVDRVFPQSVASGGPTPSGAIVWTRVAPDAYRPGEPLGLQVATDEAFTDVVYAGVVPPSRVSPDHDHAVSVDLDGELGSDRHYFYRFVYDGDATRTGRLRTLPEPDASPDRLKLAVASCNNYLHGYYGAFSHIAREDADYLLHLGDLVYEYAGSGKQPGRDISLPSGESVAHTLADFRTLHRTYRGDRHLQRALERHTLVHTWDDHEIVNNRWWNYEEKAPETQSHPYGDDPAKMRELYVAGIAALTEYLPFRVDYDPDADRLHDRFQLYRSLRFGDLAELFLTDERFYRSPPPKDAFGKRDTATPPSREVDDPGRTMLGEDQREWLVDGVTTSPATWKVWGNAVLNAALKATNAGPASFTVNYDAWDGYQAERKRIMRAFEKASAERGEALNLVTLTGDLHAYVAAYLKTDYESLRKQEPAPGAAESRVGVEFMSPGVTSDNLGAVTPTPPDLEEDAVETMVESQNPHIEWFNWSRYGYTTVEFTPGGCLYTAYAVDRTVDDPEAPKQQLRAYSVPEGETCLREHRQGPVQDLADNAPATSADDAAGAVETPDATGTGNGGDGA